MYVHNNCARVCARIICDRCANGVWAADAETTATKTAAVSEAIVFHVAQSPFEERFAPTMAAIASPRVCRIQISKQYSITVKSFEWYSITN